MISIDFVTRGNRPVRLLGCLSEATEEHLLVESLDGSTLRPEVGGSVMVSALVGRSVTQAGTTVLHGAEPGSRRLMLRCPIGFLRGNRRRHERVGTRVPLEWFEVNRGPASAGAGETTDLSAGGLQFSTGEGEVAVGDRLVLLMRLPARVVAAVCEVRSCRTDPNRVRAGVEFVALADLDRAALAQLGV